MKMTKKALTVLFIGAMTLPCFSCTKDNNSDTSTAESSSSKSIDVEDPHIHEDSDGMIGYDLSLGEIIDDEFEEVPAVTTVTGDDGKSYVNQTDINGTTVTEKGGAAVTVEYTGTTLATSYAEKNYVPQMKSFQALWLDMSKRSNFKFNGEFLVYDIAVSKDAPDGVYPIEFYHLDVANYNAETLDATAEVGYVVVGDATAPELEKVNATGLHFTPGVVSIKQGETGSMILKVENNPGFVGFDLRFRYDANAMEIQSGGAGKDFSSNASLEAHSFS